MMSNKEHHDVVIVGGGIAGLYAARKLLAAGISDVVVLESRRWLGGRVFTTREGGDPMSSEPARFNDFAWRVSEDNVMMLELAKELGLNLREQATVDPQAGSGVVTPQLEERATPEKRAPLSQYARHVLESASQGDAVDRNSGYAGRIAQVSFPGDAHGDKHWIVEEGMNAYATALAKELPDGMIRLYTRASDVVKAEDGTYHVTVVAPVNPDYSFNDDNQYSPAKTITCNNVILAVPPYTARQFTVAKEMMPALCAVHERRLGHAYVQMKKDTPNVPDTSDGEDRIFRFLPDSALQQLISGDYGNGVFQAAYACDRFERVWRELAYHGPDVLKSEIQSQLAKVDFRPPGWEDAIEEAYLRIGFVHRWQIEAHVNGKTKKELSLQAITPNPARLPGLYLVGEAFSPFQGWTEGALWTSDKAVEILVASRAASTPYDASLISPNAVPTDTSQLDDDTILYRGLVMDMTDWVERHPGGTGPIGWIKGTDASETIDLYHMGWPVVLATLFGMQKGSVEATAGDTD